MVPRVVCDAMTENVSSKFRMVPVTLASALTCNPDFPGLPVAQRRTGFRIHDAHMNPVKRLATANEPETVVRVLDF